MGILWRTVTLQDGEEISINTAIEDVYFSATITQTQAAYGLLVYNFGAGGRFNRAALATSLRPRFVHDERNLYLTEEKYIDKNGTDGDMRYYAGAMDARQ